MEAIYDFVIRDNLFPSDQDLLNGYDSFINFLITNRIRNRLTKEMQQRLDLVDQTINRLRISDAMIISFGKKRKSKKRKSKKSKRKSRGRK